MATTSLLKDPLGLRYHGGAVLYAMTTYFAGLMMIAFSGSWLINGVGVFLLAHAMVIAAYLVHECAHNTIFKKNTFNARLGNVMTWFCGANYGTFEDIRYKHFRHHADNDDVVWFDYEKFFREHPRVLALTRGLEFFYIPAHCLLMHVIMIFTSFIIPQRKQQRRRNLLAIIIRGSLFIALAIYSLKAAVLYMLAYMLMIHVLRFLDSLQHDYEYHTNLFTGERSKRRGDREWEQEHTFSVPFSAKYPVLNWLALNFGYHNAHHADPNLPWYRLPAKHKELYGDSNEFVVPFLTQLKICHQGRVERILKWDDEADDVPTPRGNDFLAAARAGQVTGGNAASFLTSF